MTLPRTDALTYDRRIEMLRATKLAQTKAKIDADGYMDGDDYGTVLPPEDWQWTPTPNHPNGSWYGYDGWARNFRGLMERYPLYVDPVDAIVGRTRFFLSWLRPVRWHPDFPYPHLEAEQKRYGIASGIGADSHFGPDYRIGLALGWGGLLGKVRRFGARHGPEKQAFYQAEEDVLLGVQSWVRRHVEAVREALAAEPRPELREGLREVLAVNEHLVEGAPRTFHEACQWIAFFNSASRAYNRDGAGDQLDAILQPYYEADVAAGRLDDEKAVFLLACLLLNDPHYYQVAGPDAQGRDQTCEVSFLILEAAHRLRSSANLTIRVHDGLDRELLLKGVRHLFEDRQGWPRFSGDEALTRGFMRNGYPAELARQRIAVGCHWMAIPGREYTMNDTVKINVAKVFEVALWEMLDGGGGRSVERLWGLFEGHLRRAVLCTAKGIDWHLDHQVHNQPELMLNLLCHGPVEKGLDVVEGGVEFYNLCVDGAGLATVADSFAALQRRIEREGRIGWDELARHLRGNYAGADGERVRLMLKTIDRYGSGSGLGDEWAVRVSRRFTELVKAGPTPGGRNLIPGWFTWSSTIKLGKEVGATPNGRRAGEPISHGANPDPGFRRDGAATAMSKAIAAIQPGYGNTAPIQLELDPHLGRDEEGVEKIAALIRTHFDDGGTLFNINILDADTLRAAHADPGKHPDLVVRVTGFTAYFAALSPEFRQLVVDRIIEESP